MGGPRPGGDIPVARGARRHGAHLKISFQVSVMSFGCPPPGSIRSVHGPSRPLGRCPDDTQMVILSLSGTGRWHSGESTPSRSYVAVVSRADSPPSVIPASGLYVQR